MSVSVNEILSRAKGSNPEQELVAKLASEASQTEVDKNKLAAEIEEEGQLWARAVVDEFKKLADAEKAKTALNPPTGITPTRAPQLQMNPGVQLSIDETGRAADIDRVSAILQGMIRDVAAPGVRTVVDQAPNQEGLAMPAPAGGEQVTNAEIQSAQQDAAAAAKEADAKHTEVVAALFDHYFGGNQ